MPFYNFSTPIKRFEEVPVAYLDMVEDVFDNFGLVFEAVDKYNMKHDFSDMLGVDVFGWICKDYKDSIADVRVLRKENNDTLEVCFYTKEEKKAKEILEMLNQRF